MSEPTLASPISKSQSAHPDVSLLDRFDRELWDKLPHIETVNGRETFVVNPTPIVDLTEALRECAREVFHLDLFSEKKDFLVLGKLESQLSSVGGSIKVRPAAAILRDAIATGKLRSGQVVFEATSGNFGIALGKMAKIGFNVVALVSRRLQEGVFKELKESGIKVIDLDVDVCPAPGMELDQNVLAAKAAASNVRFELMQYGFDVEIYDRILPEVEALLARQDVINLAKLLARAYGGFCTEQYDNEWNVRVHESVTAREIDEQLARLGLPSLSEFNLVCAFGTGGTSGGLSRYLQAKYGREGVHVVFPLANQDVGGIRTKRNARGLKFYTPDLYAGEHEVDFEQARYLLRFFSERGYDIGESSALALYAVVQMANYSSEREEKKKKYFVILADGIDKYRRGLERTEEMKEEPQLEVGLREAHSNIGDYDSILWTHTTFVPSEEGIKLIASSLGSNQEKVSVISPEDVARLVNRGEIPKGLGNGSYGGHGRKKILLVCMAGGTSLRAANILSESGIEAQSLSGGISSVAKEGGNKTPIQMLVKPALQS